MSLPFPWHILKLPLVDCSVQGYLSPQGGTEAAYQVAETHCVLTICRCRCSRWYRPTVAFGMHLLPSAPNIWFVLRGTWAECSLWFTTELFDPGEIGRVCDILSQRHRDSLSHYQALAPERCLHNYNPIMISSWEGLRAKLLSLRIGLGILEGRLSIPQWVSCQVNFPLHHWCVSEGITERERPQTSSKSTKQHDAEDRTNGREPWTAAEDLLGDVKK